MAGWRAVSSSRILAAGVPRHTCTHPVEFAACTERHKLRMLRTRASIGAAPLCLLVTFVIGACDASSAAGTETLVGIQGRDFVILGADSSVSQSIALTASNLDKIAVIVDPFPNGDVTYESTNVRPSTRQQCIVAAVAGDAADADRLVGTLTLHASIREFEAGVGCDVEVVYCRSDSTSKSTGDRTFEASAFASPSGLSVQDAAHLARHLIASRLRSSTPLKVCLLVAGMMPIRAEPGDRVSSSRRGRLRYQQRLPRLILPSLSAASDSENEGRFSGRVQQQVREATVPAHSQATDAPRELAPPRMDAREQIRLEPRLFWLDEYGSIQRLPYGAHGFGSTFALSILDEGYRGDLTKEEAVQLMRSCFAQLRLRYVINSPQPPCIKCIDQHGCQLVS